MLWIWNLRKGKILKMIGGEEKRREPTKEIESSKFLTSNVVSPRTWGKRMTSVLLKMVFGVIDK
jgi:hypothetical protein